MFDPNKAKDAGGSGEFKGLPPDDYLLAIVEFERKTSKAGRPYLQAKTKVIHGNAAGKTFRDRIMVPRVDADGEVHADDGGIAARFGMLLVDGCGWDGPIDVNSDKELRKALQGKPFKGRVKRTKTDGWVDNSIERLLVGDKVTPDEREFMSEWAAKYADQSETVGGQDDDVPPPTDDDLPF